MAGLVPAIHGLAAFGRFVDARDERGHDGAVRFHFDHEPSIAALRPHNELDEGSVQMKSSALRYLTSMDLWHPQV
jgi:hypothetical protein